MKVYIIVSSEKMMPTFIISTECLASLIAKIGSLYVKHMRDKAILIATVHISKCFNTCQKLSYLREVSKSIYGTPSMLCKNASESTSETLPALDSLSEGKVSYGIR